jgi:hypothetical protein
MGVWEDMIRTLSYVAVIYNYGLVYFTGSYFEDVTWQYRWITFILTEHAMMMTKYLIESFTPEQTFETEVQLQR